VNEPVRENLLERIDRGLARFEAAVVVIDLAIMVGLATLNLALHKLFDSGFDWADIVVRQMVLWLGFTGGALATYEGRHIAIDAVGKLMKPRFAAGVRVLTSLGAMVLSLFMMSAAIDFVKAERDAGSALFGDVPGWPFKLVMPICLGLIAFHFFVAAVKSVLVAAGKRPPPPEHEDVKAHEEELAS
jgi:TRAP-type C4-dicarboxylate transport system permease small subunit